MDGQEVTRLETTYLPYTNENRIRMYGADGELICEQVVYRQEYPHPTLWQHLNTIQSCNAQKLKDLLLGEWKTIEEEPDIKAERGGALDEFLDEFKPQTTPERSDEQK